MPRWAIVLLVTVGAAVVLVPLGMLGLFIHAYGENHRDMRFPADDVAVSLCRTDPGTRKPVAELLVTSRAEVKGSYLVTVEFLGEDGTVEASGAAFVDDLAPSGTATAASVGGAPVDGAVECVVADAVFTAS
ncbi:hypothetical protein ABZ957_29915 [Streptomyces sp. NPDC046316]|uniref:hypothetical protein n=1 Tax=Streptomyces sp. NPDC046316 TaxID=3154494 RepID=UPI0033EF298A